MPSNTMLIQQPSADVQQLRDQVRENVRQQLEAQRAQLEAQREARQVQRDAQQAARDAAQAARDAGRAAPGAPGVPHVMVSKDGKTIIVDENGRTTIVGPEGPEAQTGVQGLFPEPVIPREAVLISIAFFIMIAVIAIGVPLVRAFVRRMDRRTEQPSIPPELAEQLRRLEQSVDTIAVEVERISEGQRFSSGLLREMHPILQRTQGAGAIAEGAIGDGTNRGTR